MYKYIVKRTKVATKVINLWYSANLGCASQLKATNDCMKSSWKFQTEWEKNNNSLKKWFSSYWIRNIKHTLAFHRVVMCFVWENCWHSVNLACKNHAHNQHSCQLSIELLNCSEFRQNYPNICKTKWIKLRNTCRLLHYTFVVNCRLGHSLNTLCHIELKSSNYLIAGGIDSTRLPSKSVLFIESVVVVL